ncbi:hypothetical protein BDV10DRAFT_185615 [Aspergillus recurvatus]
MSIGSFKAAVVNGISEATATLVNFNLDFSLFKIEAPREFSPVGDALSSIRRESAESGVVHTTARKLGALFDPLLPDTPQLIKAYGSRASEIAIKSKIENRNTNYGVFESQVGVDATSIWASATSGPAAIKVHLLACILARIWESGEATAIWDEIVSAQKQVILDKCNEGGSVDMVSWVVAKQQISRKELRDWDASARAWLCVADKIKAVQQSRFWLAIDRFDLRVMNRSSTYDSVIEVWKDTLAGMELLVSGSSQELRSVNILLGLSAWHLYPDMDVLTLKQPMVRQNDELVPGILTVGLLRTNTNDDAGIQWSLPLAHLRYYGAPVQRTRLARVEGSRLTLVQFRQLILGCVLGGWGVDPRQTATALKWVIELDEEIKAAILENFRTTSAIDLHRSWMSILAEAASEHLYADDLDRRVYSRLLNLGRRKAGFIGKPDRPFFALSDPEIFVQLPPDVEGKIQCLRTIAQTTAFESADIVIRYRPDPSASFEYATALPRLKRSLDDMEDDVHLFGHTRWVRMASRRFTQRQHIENSESRYYYNPNKAGSQMIPRERLQPLDCEIIRNFRLAGETAFQWDSAGGAGRTNNFKFWLGDENEAALFYAQDTISPPELASFQLSQLVQLFKTAKPQPSSLLFALDKGLQLMGNSYLTTLRALATMVDLYKILPGATIDIKVVENQLSSTDWVQSLTGKRVQDRMPDREDITDSEESSDFESSTDEYAETGGFATYRPFARGSRHDPFAGADAPNIPEQESEFEAQLSMADLANTSGDMDDNIAEILDEPHAHIADMRHIRLQVGFLLVPFTMTREEAFACIILFESGQYNIPPGKLSSVMAISSNDSLFIAAPMLCSPAEEPPQHEIHHVTGNIGRGGMALLIPPATPRIRESTVDTWTVCNHDSWDGEYADHFDSTSLHLSYTGYNIPLDVGTRGAQDWEIYMLESVVSVHERGEWVADLDILEALQSSLIFRIPDGHEQPSLSEKRVCSKHSRKDRESSSGPDGLVALQNWAEYLTRPDVPSIVVASSNWQAQLAATAITIAQGGVAYVVKENACCDCVYEAVQKAKDPSSVVCIA